MHKSRRTLLFVGLVALALGLLPALTGAGACRSKSTFFVPKADKGATQQIVSLIKKHDFKNAALIQKMVSKGHAVWLTSGTPTEVKKQVKKTMRQAHAKRQVPVFVAYNLPYRDCGQYSAGGALNTAEYEAWIDGVAAGIGNAKALLLLEPDGLGIIPYYDQFGSDDEKGDLEWCQPKVDGNPAPEADPAHRFAQMNYAVDALEALQSVDVYLDGTHSNWLGAGDAAQRLIKGGVLKAEGFFLNASNYQANDHLIKYGTWISQCIAVSQANSWWNQYWCGSQYYPANVNDFSTWALTDAKYAAEVEPNIPAGTPRKHFVIDTSRNGLGPWTPTVSYPDKQDWCNPPGRGAGIAPTTNTGNALIDAYLWVKVPGESDGSCNRGISGSTTDPEWGGIVDPAAGEWFPQQALELAQLASPALK